VTLTVSALRVGLNAAFFRAPRADSDPVLWRRLFMAGVIASGCGWRAAGWIFLSLAESLPRVLVVFIIAGMNAGGARSLAPIHAAFARSLGIALWRNQGTSFSWISTCPASMA
jgi:hypothetical protein